jgi:hypothetical protein
MLTNASALLYPLAEIYVRGSRDSALVAGSNSFGRFQVFVVSGGKRSFVVSSTEEKLAFCKVPTLVSVGPEFSPSFFFLIFVFSYFNEFFFVFGTFFRLVVPSLVFHLFVLTGLETGGGTARAFTFDRVIIGNIFSVTWLRD